MHGLFIALQIDLGRPYLQYLDPWTIFLYLGPIFCDGSYVSLTYC